MACTRSTGTWAILATLGLAFGSAAGAQDIQACGGSPGLPTWAQSSTYQGTLGGQPIALQLSRQSPDRDRYFYERSGLDLMLTPFHAGDTLILQEEVWQDSGDGLKVTGCLTLLRSGQKLSGTWNAPGHAT